ncbi:MAG: hypothetical protein WAW16_00940 [Candidatus Cryosericum sp.]
MERRRKARGGLVIGHQEVLGKTPCMSGLTRGKEPQVPTKPDPTDEERITAGTVVARTLGASLTPGMNGVNP